MELVGIREIMSKLGTLPPGMMEHVSHAFEAGLKEVKNHARSEHPPWPATVGQVVDGAWTFRYHNITTNLTNSISLRMRRLEDAVEGDVGALNETMQGDAMQYAGKIERDHPFIGPAVEAKKAEWLRLITQAVQKFLR